MLLTVVQSALRCNSVKTVLASMCDESSGAMCCIDLVLRQQQCAHETLTRCSILTALVDLVDSCRVVFDTLYLLLSFGHETSEEADKLDPPFSYFRIRLVCSLLETCGQFFNKGLAKKRLDRFLTFFQRYLLAKPPLPLDVEFDVQVCYFPLGTVCVIIAWLHFLYLNKLPNEALPVSKPGMPQRPMVLCPIRPVWWRPFCSSARRPNV